MNNYAIKKIISYPRNIETNWKANAYIPISLNNNRVQDKVSMMEILRFLNNKHKSYVCLIGDYLHRNNIQIFGGYSDEEAIKIALRGGDVMRDKIKSYLKEFGNESLFDFKEVTPYYSDPHFKTRMDELIGLLKTNTDFNEVINKTIDGFLNRFTGTTFKLPYLDVRLKCLLYILEELVIFEMLSSEGLTLNIYPGNQLPVMKAIVNGILPGISTTIEKLSLVEIKFKKQNI